MRHLQQWREAVEAAEAEAGGEAEAEECGR